MAATATLGDEYRTLLGESAFHPALGKAVQPGRCALNGRRPEKLPRCTEGDDVIV